ncbi:MFS transporter [Cytobacillus oceanisediminis]|uniref:MFS transporter n=2 Tax=Niallia TaxID=2837506 RepID=A0A941GP97_NIACI|nr:MULTISPECIES: MFS transporter [Bacillaceae]EOR24373.1 multidrug resistance protein [Niallia nealsonii AAU1]MBQ6447618.1 MFS transporter [Bacillus sp. (in: firmicutes)]MDU1848451.1 MFS transporter [Niallia nealsonii]MBZ9535500.1 MFS transporter [Cytobacillus oceanisediminis]MCB5236777.1 MFS transporter [Niallia circulans]
MENQKYSKRNLGIMWFANFFISACMTMVLPFLSLYIDSFGQYSSEFVQHWSGLCFSVTFVAAFLFSPIWGKIGDKFGRKTILIILAIGLGISIFLMSFANSVWEVFILRFFTGFFTGFIPMSQAFISTQTPKKVAGKVLGTLQTGSITGALIGPLLGGVLADSFGYAATFRFTSLAIFISAILVFTTKEFVLPVQKGTKSSYTSKEVLAYILKNPVFITVLLISAFIQIAHFSIQPILSLYVSELHGPENIAFFAGLAFSAAGLGNLLMARKWGEMGDRSGHLKVLVILLFIAGIIYFPGGFVNQYWQLLIIRFILGVAIGGMVPVRVAYIRQEVPIAMQGEVMGYETSLRFLGNIIGPALGGVIAGNFGFSMVFFSTSILLLASGIFLFSMMHRHPKLSKQSIS